MTSGLLGAVFIIVLSALLIILGAAVAEALGAWWTLWRENRRFKNEERQR